MLREYVLIFSNFFSQKHINTLPHFLTKTPLKKEKEKEKGQSVQVCGQNRPKQDTTPQTKPQSIT